ncbi:MAG: 50S ribosomal protein L4 [Candidatus Altiarchaeales archaeon]|nr:50S ribosomal protein L4 [Candidatus Altiarchaeales archaeon]
MANVYSLDGKAEGKINLPTVFKTEYRPDLIQRAVVSQQANRRQTYGTDPYAGLRTSADYYANRKHTYRITINRGMSRLPREKPGGGGLGKVRRVPHSVKGRSAHGPVNKDFSKKINKKEYEKALKSAIAATAVKEIVEQRGHKLGKIAELPIVIDDKLESLKKTKDVYDAIANLGLEDELERGAVKAITAGKGKARGRKYKKRKSILIVVNEDKGLKKAAENIPGVDAATVRELDVELLAPGTHAGRLTLWTKAAVENVAK